MLFKCVEMTDAELQQWKDMGGKHVLKRGRTFHKRGSSKVQSGEWIKTGQKKLKWIQEIEKGQLVWK